MAVKEGLRRVHKLGRVLGTTGAFLVVVGLAGFISGLMRVSPMFGSIAPLVILGLYLMFAGFAIVIVGWVGDGFAAKDGPE
jgi:uncharacterized membrane protein HdeD (DUF308 family)